MTRARKTVNVEAIRELLNEHLERTDEHATREFKSGIALALELILLDANRYKGFHFLNEDNDTPKSEGYYDRYYH